MTAYSWQDNWATTFTVFRKSAQGYMFFTSCWHLHAHMQMRQYTAKSWLIKKVRPPNTLQRDSRFNETLMEMSFAHCLPVRQQRKGKEKERKGKGWRSVWFLMSLRAEVCHCICSGGKVSQRISRISVVFCKDVSFMQRALHHLCYNLWHEGWKCMLGVCCACSSSIYTSHWNDASLCVMLSKALNDERPFFSVFYFVFYERFCRALTEVLEPWWLMKMCTDTPPLAQSLLISVSTGRI